MIAFEIESTKVFMEHLFGGDSFDKFRVGECEIATAITVDISGKKNSGWFEEGIADGEYVYWPEIKNIVFSLIKGNKTPLKLKISFLHYLDNMDIGSIRVDFEKDTLKVYTGYMQKEFSMDKGPMQEWDNGCRKFIEKLGGIEI